MEESKLTNEMISMFDYIKESGNEFVKQGLKDFFTVLEELNLEKEHKEELIQRLNDKINKQKIIIEKQEQEKFRIIGEKRKSKFNKVIERVQEFKTMLKSEKSGF